MADEVPSAQDGYNTMDNMIFPNALEALVAELNGSQGDNSSRLGNNIQSTLVGNVDESAHNKDESASAEDKITEKSELMTELQPMETSLEDCRINSASAEALDERLDDDDLNLSSRYSEVSQDSVRAHSDADVDFPFQMEVAEPTDPIQQMAAESEAENWKELEMESNLAAVGSLTSAVMDEEMVSGVDLQSNENTNSEYLSSQTCISGELQSGCQSDSFVDELQDLDEGNDDLTSNGKMLDLDEGNDNLHSNDKILDFNEDIDNLNSRDKMLDRDEGDEDLNNAEKLLDIDEGIENFTSDEKTDGGNTDIINSLLDAINEDETTKEVEELPAKNTLSLNDSNIPMQLEELCDKNKSGDEDMGNDNENTNSANNDETVAPGSEKLCDKNKSGDENADPLNDNENTERANEDESVVLNSEERLEVTDNTLLTTDGTSSTSESSAAIIGTVFVSEEKHVSGDAEAVKSQSKCKLVDGEDDKSGIKEFEIVNDEENSQSGIKEFEVVEEDEENSQSAVKEGNDVGRDADDQRVNTNENEKEKEKPKSDVNETSIEYDVNVNIKCDNSAEVSENSQDGNDRQTINKTKDQSSSLSDSNKKEEVDNSKVVVKSEDTETSETITMNSNSQSNASSSGTNANTQQKSTKPTSQQQTKSNKQQECIVCKKIAKCKYNIVRNGDTKHLCDDKCFQAFRTQPTIYLQTDQNKTAGTPSEPCANCSRIIPPTNKTKFGLKLGKEQKKFCGQNCLTTFKKQLKTCVGCGKDIRDDGNSFMAPIDGEGFRDFCGHACLVKYEHSKKQTTKDDDEVEIVETTLPAKTKSVSNASKPTSSGKSKCAVCNKMSTIKHEVNFKGQVTVLCSDTCFSSFRLMHQLSMNLCENCNALINLENPQTQTIQFEGDSKCFCNMSCLAMFKTKKTRLVPCTYCNTLKSNFEMVERLDANSKFQMFCSLNCLSLYRVNLQANSNQSILCDQCHKRAPAQYHLTMSDASVRNFCGYNCVMAFQSQFNQPSATTSQQPTPGQQVTANTANTQPPAAAAAATQLKQSPYGTRQSSRVTKSVTIGSPLQSSMPIIANIMSLATPKSQEAIVSQDEHEIANNTNKDVANIGIQTATPEVIVQPPPPKQMKNKAMLCKPYMQTKATSCRPHTVPKGCQTDEGLEPKKLLVPCPVPTMTPTPMMMYSYPVPFPVLLPVPVPIPVFIPTTKKSTAGIMRKIKELQERVPSDPFEAELLMMAEAVASAEKAADSDSDVSEDEGELAGDLVPSSRNSSLMTSVHSSNQPSNGDAAEDMLQMALRMASEMPEEQILDLEDTVNPAPVRPREPSHVSSVPEFGTIAHDSDILQASHMMNTSPRGTPRGRGKRRGGGGSRGSGNSSRVKKSRIEEEQVVEMAPQMTIITTPTVVEPPADANFILKFTYGVNAFKHWAIQKNAQLERAGTARGVTRARPFKLDIVQCSADELNYALCLFVKEVRKPSGEEYAPDSIYYLCLGIQEYLSENGRVDNLFTDFFYEKFTDCLNDVLCHYEVRLNTQGMLVCRIEEEHLWEARQLGAHSPHVLLNTLIYFNTKQFLLRTTEDHLGLSFSHIMKHWKKINTPSGKPGRSVYLRYYAPSQSGGDASQKRKKEDLPVFEQSENVDNPLRCPVKLYEFYLSKCPESIKNRSDVFYLVPERSCVPDSPVWYSTMSLGHEPMTKMLNRLRVVREIQESQLTSMTPFYN